MSKNIVLRKGLNIPISGVADLKASGVVVPDVVAVKPTDFRGLVPRLLVREGDKVLAGSPVLADKERPGILYASPVSGTVAAVVRGAKRKLLEVRIKRDSVQEYVDFGKKDVASLSAEEVKDALMKGGLWPAIIQRPYGVTANPEVSPKGIFVSAFTTAPLAADPEFALADQLDYIQTGIDALAKIATVHLSLSTKPSAFSALTGVTKHVFKASKHPAGNVGVQISHISPIMKGDVVWTVSLLMIAAIGKLFKNGKYDVSRKLAITGPMAINPSYVETVPGMAMTDIASFYGSYDGEVRFVSGDPLTGTNVGKEGSLGFFDNQVTLLHEGTEREWFGWCNPFRFKLFSSNHAYFHWLLPCPKKTYDLDTNYHGGERTFMMTDVYGKVLPMDIYPLYLIKACIIGNIDDMEKYGIYEVLPEDFATVEFTDPSKNDIQEIISKGIALMMKEMA